MIGRVQRLKEVSMDVSERLKFVKKGNHQSREPVYNTLTVPRGENYSIVLADGTRVWVNALSSLKFPTSFKGADSRTVELVGEGFFEVAHDTLHPFRVMTAQQTIIVTGTAFNVTAYAEEVSRTTLCQGSDGGLLPVMWCG
ncbi:MAG: FecR family protein [Odoribacter splanchnicus]